MRDASTVMSQLAAEPNNEGENHNKLVSPDGAFMKDLAVGDNGDEVMLYWSRGIEDADVSMGETRLPTDSQTQEKPCRAVL